MATKISFYFDEHMPRDVERHLLERGYQVIMAVDVGMISKDDDAEHADHAGLVCWTGADDDIGGMIRVLSEFAEKYPPEEVAGQVFWLK